MVIQKGTRGELVGAIEMEGRRRRFGFQPYLFHNVCDAKSWSVHCFTLSVRHGSWRDFVCEIVAFIFKHLRFSSPTYW